MGCGRSHVPSERLELRPARLPELHRHHYFHEAAPFPRGSMTPVHEVNEPPVRTVLQEVRLLGGGGTDAWVGPSGWGRGALTRGLSCISRDI